MTSISREPAGRVSLPSKIGVVMKLTAPGALVLLSAIAGTSVLADVVRTELAGEAFFFYPHFHYVRNFNPDEAVQVAVDPVRFPQVAGSTCDLYVVADRTEIGWTLDPSLVDVRPTGAQSVTFSAANIQSNTVTAAAPGELDSDAGAGLGVGYDVILDCNTNGVLDDGDLIDGRGDEPGLYATHDTTQTCPLAVTQIDYSGGFWLTQRAFFPTDIATMGRLPLVVISHGWTHEYTWYDHIGEHLASYGYVVMSHRNNVTWGDATGSETGAATTVSNTDYILGNRDTIGGGVLDGHIDLHRISFIGHSSGAEGVILAYTKLVDGSLVANNFTTEDVVLVTSMAPVSFHPFDPFDVNYFVILGAADTDTQNAPVSNWMQPLSIFERASGNRQLLYMHGVGHEWLHTEDRFPLAEGPDLIGQIATHKIILGYYLPVMELYAKENLAGREFVTRSYDDYHPMGIRSDVIVANEYRDAEMADRVVIDDYQSQPSTGTTSSGGAVSFTVSNVEEVLMQDLDNSFDWTGSQPSNGMPRARFPGDDTRCVVFDWDTDGVFYELAFPPGERDFSHDDVLSFRAGQGTRHPQTDALDSTMSFTVELRDGDGSTSSLNFGSYGRLTRLYQRTGYGNGVGWANEFNTIRIRLADFTTNGSGLDLGDVVAVRFRMDLQIGGQKGRIGLDDVEVIRATEPAAFDLTLSRSGSATEISWPPAVGALAYNVYRGTIPPGGMTTRGSGLAVYDHTCFEPADSIGDGHRKTLDSDPIPGGRIGFYYLVAALRADGEDSLGLTSVDLDPATAGAQIGRPNGVPCP